MVFSESDSNQVTSLEILFNNAVKSDLSCRNKILCYFSFAGAFLFVMSGYQLFSPYVW